MSTDVQKKPTTQAGRELSSRIDTLRGQVRSHLTFTAASQAAVFLIGLSGLSLVLDYFFRLSYPTRIVQFFIVMGSSAWFLHQWVYLRLSRSLPSDELALAVERAYPELDCRLVSAVQFLESPPHGKNVSSWLVETVIEDANKAASKHDFSVVLNGDKLMERLAAGAVAIILAGLVSSFFTVTDLNDQSERSAVGIWARRNLLLLNEEWPKATRLVLRVDNLKDNVITVPAGAKLDIIVEAEGEIPRKVFIEWKALDQDEDMSEITRQLLRGQAVFTKVGDAEFRHTFASIQDGLEMSIWGGDDQLGPLTVRVVRTPWVRKIKMHADFPKHTGRSPKVFESTGDLAIPEQTKIVLLAKSSKTLQDVWMELRAPAEPDVPAWRVKPVFGAGKVVDADGQSHELSSDRDFGIALVVSQTLIATLDLKDLDNLSIESPPRLTFRAIKDQEPKVRLSTTGVGNMVTPQVSMPMVIRASDDYGLTKGRLAYRATGTNKGKAENGFSDIKELAPVEGKPLAREKEVTSRWELSKLKMKPGTFLSFWAEAIDNDGVNKPKSGRSQVLTVRIVTREELMNDMIRRQQEQRRAFEELIRVEKGLRDLLRKAPMVKKEAFKNARTQLKVARRTNTIRKQFLQILEEMRNNKILEDKDLVRLSKNIVEPLEVLADQSLPDSRRSLEEHGEKPEDKEVYDRNIEELETIIEFMERLKNQMLRLETLTELITRLESIIRTWDEVMKETKKGLGEEENK